MVRKTKGTSQTSMSEKRESCHGIRVVSAHGMGNLHMCEGTKDIEAYLGLLERRMLPSSLTQKLGEIHINKIMKFVGLQL